MLRLSVMAVGLMCLTGCVEEAAFAADEPQTLEVEVPVLTCGLPDCSVLGGPPDPREDEIAARVLSMSEAEIVEMVALSYGQAGCPTEYLADPETYPAYQTVVVGKLGANLGLTAAENEIYQGQLTEILWYGSDLLMAAGRLVNVTTYDDEPIPAACVG